MEEPKIEDKIIWVSKEEREHLLRAIRAKDLKTLAEKAGIKVEEKDFWEFDVENRDRGAGTYLFKAKYKSFEATTHQETEAKQIKEWRERQRNRGYH